MRKPKQLTRMQTSRSAVFICLLAAGFACTAKAEPIESGLNFGGPDAVPNQLERDQDAWTSFQQELADKGVKLSLVMRRLGQPAQPCWAATSLSSAASLT